VADLKLNITAAGANAIVFEHQGLNTPSDPSDDVCAAYVSYYGSGASQVQHVGPWAHTGSTANQNQVSGTWTDGGKFTSIAVPLQGKELFSAIATGGAAPGFAQTAITVSAPTGSLGPPARQASGTATTGTQPFSDSNLNVGPIVAFDTKTYDGTNDSTRIMYIFNWKLNGDFWKLTGATWTGTTPCCENNDTAVCPTANACPSGLAWVNPAGSGARITAAIYQTRVCGHGSNAVNRGNLYIASTNTSTIHPFLSIQPTDTTVSGCPAFGAAGVLNQDLAIAYTDTSHGEAAPQYVQSIGVNSLTDDILLYIKDASSNKYLIEGDPSANNTVITFQHLLEWQERWRGIKNVDPCGKNLCETGNPACCSLYRCVGGDHDKTSCRVVCLGGNQDGRHCQNANDCPGGMCPTDCNGTVNGTCTGGTFSAEDGNITPNPLGDIQRLVPSSTGAPGKIEAYEAFRRN
jgi:hypothetical protein